MKINIIALKVIIVMHEHTRFLSPCVILLHRLKVVFCRCERPKQKGPFSMDCRERGSHARGVHLTQDTSPTVAASVKQTAES